jgi:hypothetical protein
MGPLPHPSAPSESGSWSMARCTRPIAPARPAELLARRNSTRAIRTASISTGLLPHAPQQACVAVAPCRQPPVAEPPVSADPTEADLCPSLAAARVLSTQHPAGFRRHRRSRPEPRAPAHARITLNPHRDAHSGGARVCPHAKRRAVHRAGSANAKPCGRGSGLSPQRCSQRS